MDNKVIFITILMIFIFYFLNPVDIEKTYGGINNESGYSIEKTNDGGYILAGYTESYGSGGMDAYVIKIDIMGNKIWEKTYGTPGDELACDIIQTSDNNYIFAGKTSGFGASRFHN